MGGAGPGACALRRIGIVLLCEDSQHEAFVRRFLKRRKLDTRHLRVEKCPGGSAEQFVRERYPVELKALRSRHAKTVLIVVIDGDSDGVQMRRASLAAACGAANVEDRTADEPVVVIVPTWNIETWLAYLAGGAVDETSGGYPRLDKEGDCQPHVEALAAMCEQGHLRTPAPASLQDACGEYEKFRRAIRLQSL